MTHRLSDKSASTLDDFRDGHCIIPPTKLRSIEGVLDLPNELLTNVIEGDTASIDMIEATELPPRREGQDELVQTPLANALRHSARVGAGAIQPSWRPGRKRNGDARCRDL